MSNGLTLPLAPSLADSGFFPRLVAWQRVHGRHGLPWQGTRDPYRVWLSEIMLQQTQVATVLDYYPRFLQRFPDVQALAQASTDEVLALWSGLGYYSRARHLHRCAQQVVANWGGAFPTQAAQLQTLPGIGPSTAAAIAAFCFGERVSIVDGNVKRVLSRFLAFDGDLAQSRQEALLWAQAQALLPPAPTPDDMQAYTQGLMDLGATVCRRSQPSCLLCPVAADCQALAQQGVASFPVKTRKTKRQTLLWWWLVWQRPDGALWLQPRPVPGIWAGLYAFPTADSPEALSACLPDGAQGLAQPVLRHALTHRDLVLHPLVVPWEGAGPPPGGQASGAWFGRRAALSLGLPAPVRTWLEASA